MRRKAYAGVPVKQVDVEKLLAGREGQVAVVGNDVSKHELLVVLRWPDEHFERPWRVKNPSEIKELVALLQRIKERGPVRVALEPSGTYGDALRQALADAEFETHRVGTKAAHDYAEVFDGAPSQLDGKDAAVVAELATIGKSTPWPYQPASDWKQELDYWVDQLDVRLRNEAMWLGRLEALLARHWPEATRYLKLSSATLLRTLDHYGQPQAVAEDAQAAERLQRWGGKLLSPEKVAQVVASAAQTVGVRPNSWDVRRLREAAQEALAARKQRRQSERRLRELAGQEPILQRQGKVVGLVTACVLWSAVGDPRAYHSGGAYRKAMGLNLTERSSGLYKGKLKISKRGPSGCRRWLYLAALRQVKKAGVQDWYEAKKAKDGDKAAGALVAIMRKLVLALYQVGAHDKAFDSTRLFVGIRSGKKRAARQRQHRRRTVKAKA